MFALFDGAVGAGYHVLTAVITALSPLLGGLAGAASIVAVTIALRVLLLPLSYCAVRGQVSQARLAPQVAELRRRHKRSPEKLQQELTALYRREGTSMFAGIVPLLVQWPIFSVLYRLFLTRSVGGHANELLSHTLFGVPLGSRWLSGPGPLSAHGVVFLGLFALIALAGWWSVRLSRRTAGRSAAEAAAANPPPALAARPGGWARASRSSSRSRSSGASRSPGAAGAAGSGGAAGAAGSGAVPGWLTKALPYLTVAFAAFVPLAAGLYLLTTTAWTAAERTVLQRRILAAQPPAISSGQPGHPGTAAAA